MWPIPLGGCAGACRPAVPAPSHLVDQMATIHCQIQVCWNSQLSLSFNPSQSLPKGERSEMLNMYTLNLYVMVLFFWWCFLCFFSDQPDLSSYQKGKVTWIILFTEHCTCMPFPFWYFLPILLLCPPSLSHCYEGKINFPWAGCLRSSCISKSSSNLQVALQPFNSVYV